MRKLPAIIAFAMAALAAVPSLVAADFGLTLSNDSSFIAKPELSYLQVNRANVWLSLPLGDSSGIYVSGFYEFRGDFASSATDSEIVPLRLDVDRTELEGSLSGVLGRNTVLRFNLGRTSFIDFSGKVISGYSDGGRAELSFGNVNVTIAGGYRGLLYKSDARSFIDADDRALMLDDSAYFAPSRAFCALGFRMVELFKGHDLGLEAWAQFDLAGGTKTTNTQYLEPFVEGRIGRNLRWRAWGVLELGSDGESFMSAAAGSQLRVSFPEYAGLRITQSVAWASGATTTLRAFTPIRQGPAGSLAPYLFADTISLPFDITFKPFNWLSLSALATPHFRTTDNAPTGGGLRDDTAGKRFLGFEAGLRAIVPLTIDLSLAGAGSLFVPDTTDMYPADSPMRWTVSVSLSLMM